MSFNIKNLLKLGAICFCLWFFFSVFTPYFESFFPAWQRYNRIQEEQNLDSGALFYSNVPQTQDAELHLREAIRETMQQRREQHK